MEKFQIHVSNMKYANQNFFNKKTKKKRGKVSAIAL